MDEFVMRCSSISRKFSIGASESGTPLHVLELSNKPGQVEAKPNFQYIANMHGDETSGRVLLPQLAEFLCASYNKDSRATSIIKGMHLFLMPTMNPDGWKQRQRANTHNRDLNRCFPDVVQRCSYSLDKCDRTVLQRKDDNTPAEVAAVMDWLMETRFTAAANLHEGAVVANYPFDGYWDMSYAISGTSNPSPDDSTFQHLARAYASKNPDMAASTKFREGITNGAAWYPLYGGMQDWAYLATSTMEITLEVNSEKDSNPSKLPRLWQQNVNALLNLPIVAVLQGASGRVLSASDGSPLAATVKVEGLQYLKTPTNAQTGYWNRPLAPGTYNLTASATGYQPLSVSLKVPASGAGAKHTFRLSPRRP
eukprot:gene9515-9680_t